MYNEAHRELRHMCPVSHFQRCERNTIFEHGVQFSLIHPWLNHSVSHSLYIYVKYRRWGLLRVEMLALGEVWANNVTSNVTNYCSVI